MRAFCKLVYKTCFGAGGALTGLAGDLLYRIPTSILHSQAGRLEPFFASHPNTSDVGRTVRSSMGARGSRLRSSNSI